MNSKGQIAILDLLLYLLVLTLVLAVALYMYNMIEDTSSGMVHDKQNNEKLNNLADFLCKSPGSPSNWDILPADDIQRVGLCVSNDSYLISYDKLLRLKRDYNLIHTLIPSVYKCNIYIYPTDNPSQITNIVHTYTSQDNNSILTRRIPIIIDYGYDITSIESSNNNNTCPYNHFHQGNLWKCKSFNITTHDLTTGHYHIISKNSNYMLSNTYGENITGHINSHYEITSQLDSLIHQQEDIIYIHINSNHYDNYLVYDKNNRIEYLNNVAQPEKYTMVIEVST